MADQTDFKHIKVNQSEDDDVVIYAGAVEPDASSAGKAETQKPEPATPTGKSPSMQPPSDNGKGSGSYHATTLEDIQSSKMPKTQIIVIVLAVIALAAFIGWSIFNS